MIRITLISFLIIFSNLTLFAEDVYIPKVPSEMEFAGLKLKITEEARRDIQKDVFELRKSPTYFNIKLERVRLYFPLIEKVLKEEQVPEDFKYLCVQESGLISDQVSSSDAVGFWQFKDFTGKEVGLRIDRNIDERLNIVASTHGAARYFKRHNFYFRNWLYTVLAHMTGMTGAKKYVDTDNFGASKMIIDANTHWYVKRFLAHKIAFEKDEDGNHSEGLKLVEYTKGQGQSLSQISDNHKIDEKLLSQYNKWMKKGKVPEEKEYSVIIPVKNKVPKSLTNADNQHSIKPVGSKSVVLLGKELNRNKTIFIKINGIAGILAKTSETMATMAAEGSIAPDKFLKYNDLKETDAILEGEIYYLKPKKRKANVFYHTTEPGESLWDVSQKFGVKLSKLAKMNRMSIIDNPETGRLMWLRKTRPKEVQVEIKELPTQEQIDQIIGRKSEDQRPNKTNEIIKAEDSDNQVIDNPIKKPIKGSEKESVGILRKSDRIHKVGKGETLYSISKKYNVKVIELMNLNDSKGSISIDQELYIPESEVEVIKEFEEKEEEKKDEKLDISLHVVEPRDTIYKISKKYNINVDKLLEMNQKNNFNLSIGEKLVIKEQ